MSKQILKYSTMNKFGLEILQDGECLEAISLNEIKGGVTPEQVGLCCIGNSACNKNGLEQPEDGK
jgi:hypothetical protein